MPRIDNLVFWYISSIFLGEFVQVLLSLYKFELFPICMGFPYSSVGKKSACNAGDPGSIPGSGRSLGEGNGNPLQYSCLENPMDSGAWQATVHGVARVGYNLVTLLLLTTTISVFKVIFLYAPNLFFS